MGLSSLLFLHLRKESSCSSDASAEGFSTKAHGEGLELYDSYIPTFALTFHEQSLYLHKPEGSLGCGYFAEFLFAPTLLRGNVSSTLSVTKREEKRGRRVLSIRNPGSQERTVIVGLLFSWLHGFLMRDKYEHNSVQRHSELRLSPCSLCLCGRKEEMDTIYVVVPYTPDSIIA